MIHKYYEVVCDYCGAAINHYPSYRPSDKDLREDGAIVKNNKHFCDSSCYIKYKNKQ